MPIQRRITVKTGSGFSPKNSQGQVGDAVFWFNEDETTEHWPYPKGGQQTAWMSQAITGGNPSTQLNLSQAGTFDYLCWFHNSETGQLLVSNGVAIGPSPSGTATFAPGTVTINSGESVSWQNSDANPHQPAPDSGPDTAWFSAPIQPGQISAPVQPAASGGYHCVLHPSEKGTITIS